MYVIMIESQWIIEEVKLFTEHSQIIQSEWRRRGIPAGNSRWGAVVTFPGA